MGWADRFILLTIGSRRSLGRSLRTCCTALRVVPRFLRGLFQAEFDRGDQTVRTHWCRCFQALQRAVAFSSLPAPPPFPAAPAPPGRTPRP